MTHALKNGALALRVAEKGAIVIEDRRRGTAWRLDPARALPPGVAQSEGDSLLTSHPLPQGEARVRWTLGPDHVRVTLEAAPAAAETLPLPGAFRPEEGQASLLLPPYQGLLYRPKGYAWEETRPGGAHGNFSLCMAAMLGPKGALLITQETISDWRAAAGEDAQGPYVHFHQDRCAVNGWTPREVRLYPVDADITAVAKRYRARLKERGEFVPWAEKIARKPILENLFGALMAFIGYNKTDEVDYVAGARQLHDMGFERVLYFPVRMCNYSLGFLMGGDPPIWFSDEEIARLKAVPGALVAPWGWFIEGLDDGSEHMAAIYRRAADGQTYNGWRIDQQQWKLVCTPYQVEEAKRRFAGDMRDMDWIHYDVNATRLGRGTICHAPQHALHGGRPMSNADDVEWTRRLLGPETNGNRIVSSEGFVDRYAVSYDIGTGKVWPDSEPYSDFIPVPLTMLVLHDSCVHDWWELHNYNQQPGWPAGRGQRWGVTGTGGAAKKAAMDALYGCPPSVFPFGKQYSWVDIGSRRTFSYCIQLTDREVQRALAAALPVTRLHRRIGKLEMVDFALLTPDGAVQQSIFADGTRIVANISDREREAEGAGVMPASSWREA